MDHDVPGGQCSHGWCHNHSPKWVNLEKTVEPDPSWVLRTIGRVINRHCTKPLTRLREVTGTYCQVCGRKGETRYSEPFGGCECCGYREKDIVRWGHLIIFAFDILAAIFMVSAFRLFLSDVSKEEATVAFIFTLIGIVLVSVCSVPLARDIYAFIKKSCR